MSADDRSSQTRSHHVVTYPKAGQLDTDLNRDILCRHLLQHGIKGVRQIALDALWSAMWFRPKEK